jgi:hypothetical protein
MKKLVYYMIIWNILRPFLVYIVYGHLVILWQLGILVPVLVF